VYYMGTATEVALKDGPGFLGQSAIKPWQEYMLVYAFGPAVLAALCLLIGRLRCLSAPAYSEAKALFFFAFLFMLIGFAGIGIAVASQYRDLGLHPKVIEAAPYAGIAGALAADCLTLLALGQVGWSTRRPGVQRLVAVTMILAILMPCAAFVLQQQYGIFNATIKEWNANGTAFGSAKDPRLFTESLQAVGLIFGGLAALVLSYISTISAARRGIRNSLGA
jgi:hypothetical protein